MPSSRNARFTDTVNYIQGYAASGLPLGVRTDIANYVTAQFPRLTAADVTAFNALADEMSVKGRIAPGVARGTEAQRKQRRALVLLWRAMAVTLAFPPYVDPKVQLAMNLAPAALGAELAETMVKAAVVASGAGAAHVFNMEFAANPLAFITTRRIIILGTTEGADTVKNPLAASFENNLAFHFQYQADFDRFSFQRQHDPTCGAFHVVNAVSVVALHWSDVPGRGLVPMPAAAGPSFGGMLGIRFTGGPHWMFTTQFTGCAFCYRLVGGTLYAAHISPAGDVHKPVMTGQVLANQIMGNVANVAAGAFANIPAAAGAGGPLNVFGNGVGNVVPHGGGNGFYPPKTPNAVAGQMKWMSFFGRLNGAWELYTQSIDGAGAIMEARRIL